MPSTYGHHGPLVGAIDQGTSSTRFMVFAAKTAELVTYHQVEIKHHYPEEGWVEIKPEDILNSVLMCIENAVKSLQQVEINPSDIVAVGITNQRETTIVWDKLTGKPYYNAIAWLDNRTAKTVDKLVRLTPSGSKDYLKGKCGLPLSTYFSAVKLYWLKENVPEVKKAIREKRLLFGTVDTWLIWNLTGGCKGGIHVTDVSNASRTMLMDIETTTWDQSLCSFFRIPFNILPQIRSSSEVYGYVTTGSLRGVPISGCIGDQNAALLGQNCLLTGQAKTTYGTGCFLLYNIGTQLKFSKHGLLTTVAFQLGPDKPTFYALEGSVAVAGSVVRWLRDNLRIITSADEVESLAGSVANSHGVYFVPAFNGLYAPYWDAGARGTICGLTHYSTRAHIARAALDAVCYQVKEILEVMQRDCGASLTQLQVDGGMSVNNLLLQMQTDLLGIPVVRPSMPETTALGAAIAAGLASGIDVWDLCHPNDDNNLTVDKFLPKLSEQEREELFSKWKEAVKRSKEWDKVGNGEIIHDKTSSDDDEFSDKDFEAISSSCH